MLNPKMPSGGLEGFAVLVTGGGTGIGRACAQQLAADGAAVTICGRTESKLLEAAEHICSTASHGGSVQIVVGDVTNEEDVKGFVAKAMEPTGRLDGLIANAGGGGGMGPYHVQDTEEFTRILHLNVLGTMLCVKHSIAPMVAAGGGSFVAMSSLAGHVTHPYFGAYCVGKAGVEEMMRNCADEMGAQNIRYNAIRPGFIATEIMERISPKSKIYQSYIDNTPMDGVGQPEDVAHLARFLIGHESRWITGQCINCDGGQSLRRGPDFRQSVEAKFSPEVLAGKLPV